MRNVELTAKELETLRLAAEGLEHAEIAKRLGLRDPTVHSRLRSCRQKLETVNTVQAVAEAFRRGLLR